MKNVSLLKWLYGAKQTRSIAPHKCSVEKISDQATLASIKRILCFQDAPQADEKGYDLPGHIEDALPPLTSSNEIDIQLYGIIAIIFEDFIDIWYSKITSDRTFANEAVHTLAHCTRALEQRFRNVNLESLFLDEIPELLEIHIQTLRLAKSYANSSSPAPSDLSSVYNSLHPHPALAPVPTSFSPITFTEQQKNEIIWGQLIIQGVLSVLLPSEDLQNNCLRTLAVETLVETMLIDGLSGKICQGWLLWESITSVAEALQKHGNDCNNTSSKDTIKDQSSACMTQFESFGRAPTEEEQSFFASIHIGAKFFLGFFFLVFRYVTSIFTALRAVILAVVKALALPSRLAKYSQSHSSILSFGRVPTAVLTSSGLRSNHEKPIIEMRVWSCIAQIVNLDAHMPWSSLLGSILHSCDLIMPGLVGGTDSCLDSSRGTKRDFKSNESQTLIRYQHRLLADLAHTHLFNPSFIPIILRALRMILVPDDLLSSMRQMPSKEELQIIKKRCAHSLLDLMPSLLANILFMTDSNDRQLQQIEVTLDCLNDTYLNKHIIFRIVETIVLHIIPELKNQGAAELLQMRSVS